ncbi:helix-turn-helix domain containing protein [Amycolatopsis sp. NPDC051071]|uniref:helix-turn-helix domain containing protein n=1 Tax=Amycolatopsis sp. NPDC051071 TaxID=3154637 RepID=UPI003421F575
MNIVEEHRTEVRVQDTVYRIEVAAREGGGAAGEDRWVTVMVGGAGPQQEPVAEGRLDIDAEAVPALATVLSDTLMAFAGRSGGGGNRRRRSADRPPRQGLPWSEELDAELESRWLAGESVEEIARRFERTPGGIRARLPRVGCDPERRGAYLPVPPSQREAGGLG